jgi:hypothetical protein
MSQKGKETAPAISKDTRNTDLHIEELKIGIHVDTFINYLPTKFVTGVGTSKLRNR